MQLWEAVVNDLRSGFDVSLPTGASVHIDAPSEKIAYANEQWNLAGQESWAAWQDATAADAVAAQAGAALADLQRARANPLPAEAGVVNATNAGAAAAAQVDQARAALAAARAGPTTTQLQAATAAVDQARAAKAALSTQVEQTVLLAPAAGAVSARYRSPGEVLAPRQRVLTLSNVDTLELTVFVPADLLARLQPGSTVPVVVATAPERQFTAQVLNINDEPEFTLRQAQNVGERADSLYAVRLRLTSSPKSQPDPLLRPGVPADIILTNPE